MANLASAEKRNRQNERNRVRNRFRKSLVKTETKKFMTAVHDGNLDEAQGFLKDVTKTIDQVASKGTLHKNTAARKKARLAKHLNAARAAATG